MSDPIFSVRNKLTLPPTTPTPPPSCKLKPEVHLLGLNISQEKGMQFSLGQKNASFGNRKTIPDLFFGLRMVTIGASVAEMCSLKFLSGPFLVQDFCFLESLFKFISERRWVDFESTVTKIKLGTKNHGQSFDFQKTQSIGNLDLWFVVFVGVKVNFCFRYEHPPQILACQFFFLLFYVYKRNCPITQFSSGYV